MPLRLVAAILLVLCSKFAFAQLTPDQIVDALRKPENSTGNIADAVEAVTGGRGWMNSDMKPLYDTKIVGRAATALMRPALTNDKRKYPPHHLQILDEAAPGSVLIYVMQDGLDIAAMGNLMATTAQIRGLEGAVIDGAVRDITAIRNMQFPVFARRVSPATSVGRMVAAGKQIPVMCGGVMVNPGDYIVGDPDGVVVVPAAAGQKVVELLAEYDDKETKMMPIIQREKSILKAIEIYKRY
ncbi:MAG: RraA family protein [Betaproteobacteria bacterium]|nr:MAG: RraA family protein [Betaproteobacteria bacterium]